MLLSVRAIAEQKVVDSFKNFSLRLTLPINGRLWALNSSENIPMKKLYGKFKQPAIHTLLVFEALM